MAFVSQSRLDGVADLWRSFLANVASSGTLYNSFWGGGGRRIFAKNSDWLLGEYLTQVTIRQWLRITELPCIAKDDSNTLQGITWARNVDLCYNCQRFKIARSLKLN